MLVYVQQSFELVWRQLKLTVTVVLIVYYFVDIDSRNTAVVTGNAAWGVFW